MINDSKCTIPQQVKGSGKRPKNDILALYIMIPKVIHYCWFGPNQKNQDILACIESWKDLCPDFEIREWNERNFPYADIAFAKKMYAERKWAFVADYARLHILEEQGGFYLDTDMLLVRPLSSLLGNECLLGEESPGIISAGMIAAVPHHPFIRECRHAYDKQPNMLKTIPRVLSEVYRGYEGKGSLTVLPPPAFYPFTSETIKKFTGQALGEETYGVHLWHYSWGHPLNKFFKRTGIHRLGVRVADALGIKPLIKKLLGFI
jgi:mannosyltransferase OCH1-like enzyme